MAVPNPRNSLGEYAWVWDAICWVSAGEAWPSGDEDKMRELADAWQVMADAISEALGEADPAVMKILQAWGGGAGEAFGGLWNQIAVDPNTGLPLMQEVAAAYAAGCDQAAMEIEYAKLTVLIAVFITVIAVFVALLMAWLGGVSAGAIPGILAAGRQAVTVAFRRLIAQMGRQLLTRAGMQTALRAAGTRLGQIVSSQGFRQGMTRLGLELVEEIGEELIIDVGAQAYQMHTGERRQWDGNRTLTAGVGGAIGGVLGTGMHFAGRRVAPHMPFSFRPSQLTFPGSGMVRWGTTSLASGMQNAVVSPAASVLANGTVNGQWAMPGADAFLGGFTSGAGRTGLTMIGSSMGNVGANVTNWGLGRTGDFNPGAGLPAGGIDPALNVGTADGLGTVGGVNGGAGGGPAGAGATGSGATGGANGGAATNAASGGNTGATSTDTTSGTGSGTTGNTGADGALNVTGDGNIDTAAVDQDVTGTVPDSGSGSISLAPPTADAAVASPVDTSAAQSDDRAAPTTTDSATATPAGVVVEGAATAPAGDTAAASPPTSDTTVQSVPDGQVAATPDSVRVDQSSSSSTEQSGGGPVTAPGPEVGTTTPGDSTAGPARGVIETSPTDGFTDTGSVDVRADPILADTPPAVLPGNPVTTPSVGQNPGNIASTVPPTANLSPPAGSTVSTGPQVGAGPNTAPPTTAGPPTTGTNNAATTTQPSTTNPAAQPAPNRTPPAGPTVNPAAANSAGSVSLSPSTGPTSTNPTQPGTGSQQSAPHQQATPALGVPTQQDTTSRPDNRPAPGRPDPGMPTAPTVPAQTAGTHPPATTVDTTGPSVPDTAGDPVTGRTDQVSPPAEGPVVVPVPGSTGSTVHNGPVGPVGPGRDTGQVNPETLRRSESPTGRGTYGWHLEPTSVSDPTSPDAERTLVEASRTLAEAVRLEVKGGTISKAKQPGMAGALLMPNGDITTHTSMTPDKSTKPPTQPAVHPLAQAALDRTAAVLGRGVGGGHGKCAEVALVSDQLYRLEQQWRDAGQPGRFETFALNAFENAKIVTHQVATARSDGVTYDLGHYRPPCRSCAHFLPQFNVDPITDPDRDVSVYQPPVPGVVGNGPPLSDNRPYGRPEGLVAPDQADQAALDAAVPRDAGTGRPTVHPDPREGSWAGLVNDGGPTTPGRDTNCADVGLSVLSTWYGRPDVAAVAAGQVELGSTARQEQALRASFGHQGSGSPALEAVAEALRAAGPGAAALVVGSWPGDSGRAHTWNAVNHEGTIIWIDGQHATLSDGEPLYADRVGDVWAIVLDAEGDPIRPVETQGTTNPVLPPDSTASDVGPRIEPNTAPSSVVDPRFTDPNAAIWPDMQGWPMQDTRQYGPEQLAPLEDPRYQDDVADSLWTPEGYAVFADPSTHPYGRLINDGGPDQPGRSNNCVDSTLAALASFYGDPQVSHPRWPDRLDDGSIETELGELAGVDRIANWIGGDWVGDSANEAMPGTPVERAEAVADRYAQLYQSVLDGGPGTAAVVVVDWVQFDGNAAPLLDADGHTQAAAQHAFLLVYPEGADGPVWWDPLYASTTTDPLPGDYVGLTQNLWSMEVHPGYADEQGGSPAADDPAARDGQPGGGLPLRVRLGSPGDALPAAAGTGPADGPGGLHHRPDGSGDRASQSASTVGHEAVHDGPPGGPDHRPAGLADTGPDGLSDPGVPTPDQTDSAPTDTDHGLSETRRIGPGELAPLEHPGYQSDVEQSLRTPEGYALFADPSTHAYGRLVNDGGPDQPGRANNCLDSSLAALSSFYGDPQVSLPRWPDVRPDGSIETLAGEASGLDRAEAWLGVDWSGGSADLPTTPTENAAAVAEQYARLHQWVAAAGPGTAALVVVEWRRTDPNTGDIVLDGGHVQAGDSHSLVVVHPEGADGPVWWDPQRGMTWPQPPAAYMAQTYALWSMVPWVEGGPGDTGRGAGTDHTPAGHAERDRDASVRVRVAGEGATVATGTGPGPAPGPRELHSRPDGSGHGADESAGATVDHGVHPGPPGGPDHRPPGLADGGPDGLTDVGPAPSLPESRRYGPGELAPLEDPRYQDDLAASLATPQGYAVFADPSTHPYGQLVNDGGPDQPGRANNCLDASLAALASFHGDPQVSVPRWADRTDDGAIDLVSGERGGLERAEAWIGGEWIGGPDNLPTDLSARTDAVADQYADLYRRVAEAGPGASALVVADWLYVDAAGQPILDAHGQPEIDGAHAFVIVFPVDADAPVWWDPQSGTTSADMPAADIRETHALWAMMMPDGEGRVDRGRGADTDQQFAGDPESDRAPGVRVRLAGPGEALGAGPGLGDARGPGELHHRPLGSDHRAPQPAAPAGHAGVRPGATRGADQGPAGVARGGTDNLTGPADRTDVGDTRTNGDRAGTVITASALPGTDFHGQGRAEPDPDAVLDRARAVAGQVATHAEVSEVLARPDGTYQVTRADGSTFTLRLTSGPVADGAVATSRFGSDGVAVVTLSDRAADRVVERGLAHEVAELSALGRPVDPAAPTVAPLSPADLAELRTAAHQVAVADRWSLGAARRELAAVVDRLGLRDGMLGAEQRLSGVPAATRTALTEVYPDWYTDRRGRALDRLPAAPTSDPRPTGLPRLRTYVITHIATNSTLTALAVKLTVDAGRPELALMLGVGGVIGAVATGPAKWLAKRAGLAAEDRRARHDARHEARSTVDSDVTTGREVAARADDVGPPTREADSATGRLESRVEALGQRLDAGERRRRLIGRPRRFAPPDPGPPASGPPTTNRSDPSATADSTEPVGLTPHEQGRLAELRALAAQRDAASTFARPRVTREIRALLDALGLRQNTPGVEQRRELLPEDLRSMADRFGGSRTAMVRHRLAAAVDGRPTEGDRPGKVAPWWMGTAENAPSVLAAGSIAVVGDLVGQLRLGWFAITAGLTAMASGSVVDPIMARREAAAKDARDTWDTDHPAMPADAQLTQLTEAVTGPVDLVTDRVADVVRRTADLEQRVVDLDRRLAESHRRNSAAGSFRRLLFGDPAWAGLAAPDATSPTRPGDPTGGGTTTADPSTGTRDPGDAAALRQLADLAARHDAARGPVRIRHARHLRALLNQLGLRDGTPGAAQRREHLPAELRPVAERHGRRLLADRMARIFVGRPADATDSDARPSNVPNAGVYAVEQTPGPLVQAATTVGLAGVIQVAAGAGPLNMAAGGVLGSVRDLALKRMETSVKDARRKWDLDHPNPAADSAARVDRLAVPTEVVVTDAARRLRVAVANLGRVTSAVDRLAGRGAENGPPAPTPSTSRDGDTTTTEGPDVLRRADSWELQVAESHVRTADPMSLKPALRELYAVIDRLGLREGMFGRVDRVAQLSPEARQVVVDYGGDRASRSVRLRTLRGRQRYIDVGRPPGVPSLRTYLRASFATTGLAGAGGTAIALALSSPLAPIIPVAALAAVPVIGAAKWYAKRASLAADDVRTRFDARSDARAAADKVDQVVDRLQEPVRELGQATADLEARLDAAESAADRLTERLAGAQQRNGVLGRLFGAFPRSADPTAVDPTSSDPAAGRPDGGTDPDSGRITAAAVPDSGFHGLGRPAADPAAVLDLARAALPQIAPYAQVDAVVQVGPDLFEIRVAGQYPLTVRITTGPLTDGVVAQSTRDPDGTFTVTVSDRAVDQVVARALAHEVAELSALHESGQALVGPLDPGNVDGRIDPAGLTAHDRGRMAEIRLLAAAYADADPAGRLALRTEIDALADHLGLRVGDPEVRGRWALLPGDVMAHLVQLSVPALTPAAVSEVLAGTPDPSEVERVRLIDYRARLAPDFQVPQQADLANRLRELAIEAEQAQTGIPRMPSFAGSIVGLPPAQLDRIRAVAPDLADRLGRDGIYVDVTGRYDLRPYMVDGVPAIDLGAARPVFDLTTESGRRAQLHEDRQRAHAALRGLRGDQAATILADHEFHYQGTARWMGLVPDVLTETLRGITPTPPDTAAAAETAPTEGPAGEIEVTADRVTLPAEKAAGSGPVYGAAFDARTGQPAPLFDGPPKRTDVQQGALGDCGMIAVIGSVAGHLPDTVARMFHTNPDGSVDVLLHETDGPGSAVTPTGRLLRVTVFPDVPVHAASKGRSAYADQSMVGTSWASLLEKAIAAVDRTWTPQRHDQWQRQWSARPDVDAAQAAPLGYARLGSGSSRYVQAELLSQITGLPTRVDQLDPTPGREADAEARLAALLDAGSPVITGTHPAARYESYEHGKPPHGLYAGHAYEVVSVTDGEVRLRNPWNDSHPAPMPIRDFLDLMRPTYAHVELARSTVEALPDSQFHGHGRPAADPTAVRDRARLVLPTLAESIGATEVVAVGPDAFEVRTDGLDPLRVRVVADALPTGTVAQTTRNLDGTFTLAVSDRAADSAVDRALAHETAELLARHETGVAKVGLFDQDTVDGPIDPAGLTVADRGRLAELRLMATWYAQADPTARLALRAEIDTLVDHLGLRSGTPDARERLAVVPADVWYHVMTLSLPAMTPETVNDVLAYRPDPTLVERYRAIDYRDHLAPDFRPPPEAAELTAKLRELAVHGEQRQSSMPRMPALAGQLIGLPPNLLDQIRQVDPRLADRVAAEGVYVDLTGRFDLRPYTLDGAPEFTLTASAPAYDLNTPAGRQALLAEDRIRIDAAFRAAYGTNRAAMAVLTTHAFHYQTDARRMALVPNALTEALRSMMPPETEVEVESTPTVTTGEVTATADRVTLPDPVPRRVVEYGRPMDTRTGRPAPVFDGPPRRDQVRQGMLGDCGVLATIAAVAGHRPDVLAQLFQTNADGTVDVLLYESTLLGETMAPTGRRLRITVTPDVPLRSVAAGSAAYADQSVNGAAWASLLEKALAAVDRTWSVEQRQQWQSSWLAWHSPDDPHQAAPTGYARLNIGSTPDMQAQLLTQLTGAPSRASTFDVRPGQEAAVAARLGELLAAGSPIITGTLPKRDYPAEIRHQLPFGLVPGHAYEVVAVADGRVSLRNPWNFDHPAEMPILDFLHLMSTSYAHLDVAPAVAPRPAATAPGPLETDAAAARLDTPSPAPKAPAQSEPERSHRHSLGRTFLDEHPTTVGYFALLGADGTVNGLLVVVSSEHGQRTAHWSADGGQPGVGGSMPVSREAAEQIAQDVLGFRLPEESVLHDMVNG
ncbi:toxin glutamine deamidase domain-containing protein [Micromonospora sp. NPDC003816]|uniref:toxin glutamine deamidase domain-containing protein n=1 Tax=Micromonospora sp. NPDC003816 TaxID=3364224 RepID=UPI0036C90DCF